MKTRLLLLLALAASVPSFAETPRPAVSLAHEHSANVPSAFVVGKVNVSDNTNLERGATEMTVRRLLGSPVKELSPDVWIYSGFQPDVPEHTQSYGCDNLLVTFADGKVVDLKMVNLRATEVIAANLNRAGAVQQIAKANK